MLLAYFCSGLLVFVAALPLWMLGLLDQRGSRALPGHITGPYYPGGVWAVATDLAVAVVIVAVTTLAIDWTLRELVGFAISRRLLFLTLALTAWAPALGLHLLAAGGGIAFLATLVVVRWKAVPAPVAGPEPWPWKSFVALLVVSALLIGSYTTFHPLFTAGLGDGSGGAVADVRNNGPGTVTLLGSDFPASVREGPSFAHRGLAGLILPPHASVTLSFRTQCPPPVVHLRYRLFGHTWSEPLPLPTPCPR